MIGTYVNHPVSLFRTFEEETQICPSLRSHVPNSLIFTPTSGLRRTATLQDYSVPEWTHSVREGPWTVRGPEGFLHLASLLGWTESCREGGMDSSSERHEETLGELVSQQIVQLGE